MTSKIVVLHGLGGIGKSSIALEYSFRYSKSYKAVFWVDVTSGTSLSQSVRGIAENLVANYARQGVSYDSIASTLGLRGLLNPDGEIASNEAAEVRVTAAVKEWLGAQHNEQWLLVLDNYDDVDAVNIHRILPTCDNGNVIITSRKSNLQALGKKVLVDEINEQSGTVLPAVQVRTSPDWNRPSSVQSSLLKFRTGIGPVHNFCALVRNQSGLVWTA